MPFIGNVTTSSNVNGSQINNGTITGDKLSLPFDYDSATLYLDSVNNRVGIGTTSPDGNLTIGGLTNTGGQSVDAINVNRTDGLRLFGVKWDVTSNEVRFSGNTKNYVFRNGSSEAETARVDSSGRLLVGTSTARSNFYNSSNSARFQIEGSGSNDNYALSIVSNYAGGTNGAQVILAKSGGSNVGDNTLVSDGNTIGQITFQGADGTDFVEAAKISAEVNGTPGANDMPGCLVFSTTADGAATSTERIRINSAGRLLVGTSAAPGCGELLRVEKASTGTEGAGIRFGGTYSIVDTGTQTITVGNGALVFVSENSTGDGALFFCGYKSATVTLVADPNSRYANTVTAGRISLTKSANSANATLTNNSGASRSFTIGKINNSD